MLPMPSTRSEGPSLSPTCRPSTDTGPLFARFPHLARIELLWGSPECRDYLHSLVMDNRNGRRQGFPFEYATAIMRLVIEHDMIFPQFVPGERPWGFGSAR